MRDRAAEREVARIASDPDAFEAFYRRHLDRVRAFVVRRVADPHLAADLIADVFVAAIDTAHTYRADLGDPSRWLYGVARNVVATERRRHARELRAVGRVSGRALVDDDDVADLVERIDAAARARRLYEAIERWLSDEDRELLELVAVDGVPVAAAARSLGLSDVAGRVRLHRARRLLRDRLAPAEGDREASPPVTIEEVSP